MYMGKTALSDTDYTSHTSQIEKSGLISSKKDGSIFCLEIIVLEKHGLVYDHTPLAVPGHV